MMPPRLLLDVSSLVRWTGPPVGIARAEHALACAALCRPDATLVVYDRERQEFRCLAAEFHALVIGWSGMIDFAELPRHGWRAWLPNRRPIVNFLEWRRLTARNPLVAAVADALQLTLLSLRRHGTPVRDAAGQRIGRVPAAMALTEAVHPGPGDIVLSAGSGWAHLDARAIGLMKRRLGFRLVLLCYDLIPMTHPQFWLPETLRGFRRYWRRMLATADLVIVNAACIAADIAHIAAVPPATAVLTLGYDPPGKNAGALPPGLIPDRFALFVSTIEPRKGHSTLLAAWRSLLAEGLPQRHGFCLVFVGRIGWMVDDVLAELRDPKLRASVLHLQNVGQDRLEALYRSAAFGLYPSLYEGFGLPVIEAMARALPMLVSDGGALPATAAGLAPCLPAGDVGAWRDMMARWIVDPGERAAWRDTIRRDFSHPDWETAAGAILDAAVSAQPRSQQQQA